MSNRKFFFGVIFICIFIVAIVYPCLFFFQLGVQRNSSRYIEEWFNVKENYAESIQTKKIMIVSGSNSLFSIEGKMIEEQLDIPTVNYGLHAGLGLEYILYRAEKLVKKGDIVLLPLEYEMYMGDTPFGGEYNLYISAYDPQYFINNTIYYKLRFIYTMKMDDIRKGIKERFFKNKGKSGYADLTLNKNGDIIGNYAANSDEGNTRVELRKHYGDRLFVGEKAKVILERFVSKCKRKGAVIIVTFPAYYSPEKRFRGRELEIVRNITDYLKANEEIVLLSSYEKNLYDMEDFYDGNYHMNDRGRCKRTKQIIKELKELHFQ